LLPSPPAATLPDEVQGLRTARGDRNILCGARVIATSSSDAKIDRLKMLGAKGQAFLKTLLADTKEYAIIAVRPLHLCISQLVARDLNLRN
jgi:hypothetical protein